MLLRSLGSIGVLGCGLALLTTFSHAQTPAPTNDNAAPAAGTQAPATGTQAPAPAATPNAAPSGGAAQSGGAAATSPAGQAGGGGNSPVDVATNTPKGQLKNPYADFAKVADEGHQKFMSAGCNGCHGGGGGGGMGPPLTNEIWVYGNDSDTLFRLIALGSDGLKKQGYARKGSENVVGPMPAMGTVVKSEDDLWKIIAWIHSVNPSAK
jgi:mono/diheme cytochrome c family protein